MKTVLVNAENLKEGDVIVCKRNVRVRQVISNRTTNIKNRGKMVAVLIPHRGLVSVLTFSAKKKVKVLRPKYNYGR